MSYKITLYYSVDQVSGIKDYLPFSNDYSNVFQFDSVEDRDKYFDAIPDYRKIEINETQENRIFFNGGIIKLATSSTILHDIDFSAIKYMKIESTFIIDNTDIEYPAIEKSSIKYYFVNSYEIVSSYKLLTVIAFNIEYDYWMNNQFDFVFRESNIERMHVDRWSTDGEILFRKPQLDVLDADMKIKTIKEFTKNRSIVFGLNNIQETKNIIWAMVTATHSLSSTPDQIFYHFIPLLYEKEDIQLHETEPTSDAFFLQNCIRAGTLSPSESQSFPVVFPSLMLLDNAFVKYACGNGRNWGSGQDNVEIINIQLFNYLPLRISVQQDLVPEGYNFCVEIPNAEEGVNKVLPFIGGSPGFPGISSNFLVCSVYTTDLNFFNNALYVSDETIISDFAKPIKPQSTDDYNKTHEPALYMNPCIKRYVVADDNTAISEICDELMYDAFFANDIRFKYRVSFSATSAYNYVLFADTINSYNRVQLNNLGFAFNKISYLHDFIKDGWVEYITTQRDSDRAMMWTNIVTSGIAEGGSTGVSAGIGYRSNMERAIIAQNDIAYGEEQAKYYSRAQSYSPDLRQKYTAQNKFLNEPNKAMYTRMAGSAMKMSAVGGVSAFSANAVHQVMAQRNKENAIRNKPGTLASAGNDISSIVNEQFGTSYIEMVCEDYVMEQYANLFNKYGYYIGSVSTPNISSRKYFNYIKTNGVILTGYANNLILSALANIFDTGVTVWHMDNCVVYRKVDGVDVIDELRVYDYTKENIERSLITNE